MLKVFYSPNQSVKSNQSFSPSAGKPEIVVRSWIASGKTFELVDFAPVSRDDLKLVHAPSYVDGVLDLTTVNGFGNKNAEVASALPWVAGSMVAATLEAFKSGSITISPTSGAHHAHYTHGGGFCTFNFLVLAALFAHREGAKKVGIIDLDCHYGDGTQNIIDELHWDFIKHYSYGNDAEAKRSSDKWLKQLQATVLGFDHCDLVIYNAGVDCHIDDPLGGYLTTEHIIQRERVVLEILTDLKIPVAVSLAGGYQKDSSGDISKVVELHTYMFDQALALS